MPVAPVVLPAPLTPGASPAQHATVRYADNLLTIQASNSSLNQILRSVMRQTGLQITGGVTEDRVYGTYGPARMGPLLTSLLTGTGSNVIFVPASADKPAQLILSPRNGGSMPPPPSASANAALDADPVEAPPVLAAAPVSTPSAIAPAPASGLAPTANPMPTATVPPLPPKAAPEPVKPKTPEEIVEEIMRRRAAQAQFTQQQKNPPPATAPATPPAPSVEAPK